MLHTALGGAGLAVAFTAPLGGLVFVCEEVTGTVRPRGRRADGPRPPAHGRR